MAYACDLCGKKHQTGNNVSHANNRTKRVFNPNLQRVKAPLVNGSALRIRACTRCLRSVWSRKPSNHPSRSPFFPGSGFHTFVVRPARPKHSRPICDAHAPAS